MSKTFAAEYDEKLQTLHLAEPLKGVRDHQKLRVSITPESEVPLLEWTEIHDAFAGEAGEKFARAIEDAFPIEK